MSSSCFLFSPQHVPSSQQNAKPGLNSKFHTLARMQAAAHFSFDTQVSSSLSSSTSSQLHILLMGIITCPTTMLLSYQVSPLVYIVLFSSSKQPKTKGHRKSTHASFTFVSVLLFLGPMDQDILCSLY